MDQYWLALGALCAWIALDLALSRWRGHSDRKDMARRERESEEVLHAHGLDAYLYLASVGVTNTELRDALAVLAGSGKVVLDRDQRLVGRLVPKTEPKGPGLRLVVDNTK